MITLKANNIFTDIVGDLDPAVYKKLERKLSFRPAGYVFSPAYNRLIRDAHGKVIRRMWDGWKKQCWKNTKRTYFPTGLLSLAREHFDKNNIRYQTVDLRQKPVHNINLGVADDFEFRPYQDEVIESACSKTRGIIEIATGGGKCINAESICLTNKGMLKLKEFDSTNIKSQDFSSLNIIVSTPITKKHKDKATKLYYDGKKSSLKITTRIGLSLTCTPNHQVITLTSSGDTQWKRADNLQKGDYLVLPNKQMMFGKSKEISLEDGYWLGLLTGDGGMTTKNVVHLTNEDDHIIKFTERYCSTRNISFKNKPHQTSKTCRELLIYSSEHKKQLNKWGLENVKTCLKEIPIAVRRSPQTVVAEFVRGMFETDGWVEDKPSLCISSCSKILIEQLQVVLLNFGILSTIRIKKTNRQDAHILTIYGKNLYRFSTAIGLDPKGHKYKKLEKQLKKRKQHNENLDVVPYCSNTLRSLIYSIRQTIPYHKTSETLSKSGISYRVIYSWIQGRRKPARQRLIRFCSWCVDKNFNQKTNDICHKIIKMCVNAVFCSIDSIEHTNSDNYDFVVPESNSFVAQSLINHNTCIGAGIIQQLSVSPFIFFVTSIDLLTQTKESLENVLRDNGKPITVGQIGGGVIDIRDINVMTVQTAVRALGKSWNKFQFDKENKDDKTPIEERKEDIQELIRTAQGSIADEVQHWRATTCQLVCRELKNSYYTFGMSATPYRDDDDDMLIQACFGKNIATIGATRLIDEGFLVRPTIKMIHLKQPKSNYSQWQSIYKDQVVENEAYNNIIANIANKFSEAGRLVLVLVTQIAHGKDLADMINGAVFLSGSSTKKKREEGIRQLRNRDISCIVSTNIFDEGIDVKPLDTVILAGQGKSKVTALQRIGRILRPYEDENIKKTRATAIDFCLYQKYLKDHAKQRLKMYASEPGFVVEELET